MLGAREGRVSGLTASGTGRPMIGRSRRMSLTETVADVAESLGDTISSTASKLAEEAGNVASELKTKVPGASSSSKGRP
jgi:hypothetical protein